MKRLFDFILSLALILILSPLLFSLFITSKIFMGNPIFFKQKRPGLNEVSFEIIKFRTMKDKYRGDIELPEKERITRYGAFLRSTSLDELPELFNVLKGEMSLVGPRPLLMEYLDVYNTEQRKRHSVRPGITGLAQAYGRNSISWREKLELDIYYINNRSFFLDMKILFKTFITVLKREGINQDGSNSMKLFSKEDNAS